MVFYGIDDWHEYVQIILYNLTVFTDTFVVALLTQMFYCYRVAILTRSKYAVAVISMVREKLLAAVFIILTTRYIMPALYYTAWGSYSHRNADKSGNFDPQYIGN